jgi:hypothetical protein
MQRSLHCGEILSIDLQSYHLEIVNCVLQIFSAFQERFWKCCIATSYRA